MNEVVINMKLEVYGTSVYCELQGESGPKIVLLHGWGCSTKMMEPVAKGLLPNHRVLMIDFPGHGKSGEPPEPWGVPEYAECLKEILEELDFAPCSVIAHSFGCRVATWAAGEWPELFDKIVLTGAAGIRKKETEDSKRRSEKYQKKKKILMGMKNLPFLKNVAEKLEEKLRRKYGSPDYVALSPEMRKTFVKVISQDLRERYPMMKQSTLLIWGDQDTETPLEFGKEMEKLIPDAGLVIFEGGGHFAYLEQIGRFNRVVSYFLSEVNG